MRFVAFRKRLILSKGKGRDSHENHGNIKTFLLNNISVLASVVLTIIWSHSILTSNEVHKMAVLWIGITFMCANHIYGQLTSKLGIINIIVNVVVNFLWVLIFIMLGLTLKSSALCIGWIIIDFLHICGYMYRRECEKRDAEKL